ncbi:MAG TPA: nickel insertion protein, partial [Elusimicrobiota bacterium]|nr:nickel insertion protein [Elusimicrobiota bacterium]
AGENYELATPTGLALLSTLVQSYDVMPAGQLKRAGYGCGQQEIPGKPNVLAIYEFQATPAASWDQDQVILLETVIDDMDPRLYPHVADMLFKSGALDVWWIAAGMKKGRPGTAVSVLCRPAQELAMVRILFTESTTLGIRRQPLQRWVLPRYFRGNLKIARLPGGITKAKGEYEITRRRAGHHGVPLVKLLK